MEIQKPKLNPKLYIQAVGVFERPDCYATTKTRNGVLADAHTHTHLA